MRRRARDLWRALARRGEEERDLDDEIRFHLEMEAERNRDRGMDPEGARRAARLSFGGVEGVKEACRDERRLAALDALRQDLAYSFRALRKSPGFAAAAVATLALGIGANAAIFSLVNAALLRPFPYPEAERIVLLQNANAEGGTWPVSEPEFLGFRETGGRIFDALAAVTLGWVNVHGADEPARILAVRASPDLFAVIGVPPARGRALAPEDAAPGARPVAVVSHGFWRRELGGDPAAVGRDVELSGRPHTVVGIMPEGFRFLWPAADAWLPLVIDPAAFDATSVENHNRGVVGRLAPGIPRQRGEEELAAAALPHLRRLYPDHVEESDGVALVSLREHLTGSARTPLLTLLAAVGCVLLVACVNVANLQLARAETRRREISIRAALGAGRGRIGRQLLTESLVLAALGGALGLALAAPALSALLALAPAGTLAAEGVVLDLRVVAATLAVTVLAGVAFGAVPALRAAGRDPQPGLREGGRGTAGSRRRQALSRSLVAAEVALAAMLVIAAGLLLRSLAELRSVAPGFETEGVLLAELDLPAHRYPGAEQAAAFYRQALQGVRALPGVEAAAVGRFIPLASWHSTWGFVAQDQPEEGVRQAYYNLVSPGYFEALGIPVLAGRGFLEATAVEDAAAVLVNESLARRLWPEESALGKRLNLNIDRTVWREVVGVVGDVRGAALAEPAGLQIYLPLVEVPFSTVSSVTLAVRAGPGAGAPALAQPVKERVRRVDAGLPVSRVQTLEEVVAASVARPRFTTLLLTLFGGLALALAAVGIYGVVSYTVSRRTGEIGVRIALGAGRPDVARWVLAQGMAPVAAGLAAGMALAVAASGLLRGLLYEVSATDATSYLVVTAVLAGTALAACSIPARRAARIDPATTLRED